jgi:hypothetical protein
MPDRDKKDEKDRAKEEAKSEKLRQMPLDETFTRQVHEQVSSKRLNDPAKGMAGAGGLRASRPRSGRSGSASNASRRSRGH